MNKTMKRLIAAFLLSVPLALTALPICAQPANPPPQTTVSSFISLMNEMQKRGPNVYVERDGNSYRVVGPLDAPRPVYHPRHQHKR